MQAFKATFSSSNPNIATASAPPSSSPTVPPQAQPPTIGIPLKDWESKVGQLSETQTTLFVKLQKQFEHKNGLGLNLPLQDNLDNNNASPRTNQIQYVTAQETLSLDRIDNIGQFYTWYDQLDEDSMQEEKYRSRIERLKLYQEFCNHILQEIANSFNYLQSMEDKYNLVSKKTGEIHQACQNLLQVENQLVSFAEKLSEKLNYFNELPKMTSKLSSSTVTYDAEFKQLLSTLDQCIDFVLHNRDFKESETYLLKYRQLQNRALGLLKGDITASLKTTTSQILLSLKDVVLDDTNVETYFYVKFRTLAPKLKPMIEEMEKRTSIKEYGVLLSDCEACYFQQRRLLLSNHITNNIMKLSQLHQADLCHMTRLGCVFIMNVCYNEFQLHQHFFTNASFGLSGLLETFANILYYAFRPLYIRNHNIEIMCQLVYLLRTEILSDSVEQRGKSVEPFRVVVLRMLQDVQERLSFIVENFIRDEIEGYPPEESDLNYPAKLNTPIPSTETPAPESPTQLPTPYSAFMPYKSLYQTWYPTLEKTLVCLSKLYLTVDSRIFEELAAEAVRSCTLNIAYASKRIQAKSTIDGQLFLIKHLITLREQITPFDVNFAIVEQNLDFTYLKNVWYQILQGPGSVLSWSSTNPFLQLLQTPAIEISQDLERELKIAIENFIMTIIKSTMDPLISFLTKSSAFIGAKNQAGLREQPFATPEKINVLLDELLASVTSKLDTLLAQIQLYIPNQSTQLLLCRPVSDQTIDTVEQLRKIILAHYTEQDKQIIQLNKVDAIENLLRTRLLFTPTSIKNPGSDNNNNGIPNPSVQDSNQ